MIHNSDILHIVASFLSKHDNAVFMQVSHQVYKIINRYIYDTFTFTIIKNKSYDSDFLSSITRMVNICFDIPACIQQKFTHCIPRCLNTLYPNVVYLELGDGFNRNVDGLLPNKLVWLKFGASFNMSVNNLPESIKVLIFGNKFNQPVENLPSELQSLTFGKIFDRSINKLPDKLEYLTIHCSYIDKIPPRLVRRISNKELVINYLDSNSSTCESSLMLH